MEIAQKEPLLAALGENGCEVEEAAQFSDVLVFGLLAQNGAGS